MNITVDNHIYTLDGDLRAGNWQIIFKTHSGLDYCRETLDGAKALADVKLWAEVQARVHGLAGAEIERW